MHTYEQQKYYCQVSKLENDRVGFFCIQVETHRYEDGQSNSDSRMQTNTSARERSVLKLSALTTNIIVMYIFSHYGHSDLYSHIQDIEYLMLNAL